MISTAATQDHPRALPGVRAWLAPPLWRLVVYSFASLPAALLGGVLMVFGIVYSAVLAPIGLILLLAPAAAARKLARGERRRASRYLGLTVDEPAPPPTRRALFARGLASVRDAGVRREILYFLLAGPAAIAMVLVAGGSVYLILRGLAEIAFIPLWPEALDNAWGGSRVGAVIVHVVPGVLAAFAGPRAIVKATGSHGKLVQRLLGEDPAKSARRASP